MAKLCGGAVLHAVTVGLLLSALAGYAQPPRPAGFRPVMTAAPLKKFAPAMPPWSDSRPYIQKMVDAVSSDSMMRTIGVLQAFGTTAALLRTRDGGMTWLEELSLLNLGWGPNLRRIDRLPKNARSWRRSTGT
jgi:hypothetical protein